MKFFVTATLLYLFLSLNAQKALNSVTVDRLALQIPDSLTATVNGIADFINTNFSSKKDKSRAIFVWITNNISYDIENAFAINFYANSAQIIEEVLRNRKGDVCTMQNSSMILPANAD